MGTVMKEGHNATCIIGMHRSGTSLIVRLLNLCGLYLGPSEGIMAASESNPRGHWENWDFVRINELLLSHHGGAWDNPPSLKADWERDPSLEEIVGEARLLLKSFSDNSPWGWKDPRATLLLPFWRSLIPDLRFVICIRSPIEVAKSLAVRDSIPLQKGVDLWNHYMQVVLRDTEGCPRIFIFYEDLFKEGVNNEIERLAQFCRLEKPVDLSGLYDTISPELKHHASEVSELLNDDKVITEYKIFYMGLCALCTGGFAESKSYHTREALISENIGKFFRLIEDFHDQDKMAQLQAALNEKMLQIIQLQGVAQAQEKTLLERDETIQSLQNTLSAIYGSLGWKVLKGIGRIIDRFFPQHTARRRLYEWVVRHLGRIFLRD